jgi:phage repressor protein C with HTH and peptisase S24 domain
MTGYVFHPGHQALHGITVVVETSGETYVGRYDTEDQGRIHLLDAGSHHSADSQLSKDEYVRKCAKFGVVTKHKHLVIPAAQVTRITPLGDIT